jgi:TPR repeat protein
MDCDLYAASPRDEERWAPGVEYEKIETAKAVPACEAAAAAYPQEERFRFQLARALDAAKDYKRAAYLYRDLASAGHWHATTNMTEMIGLNTKPGPDPDEVKRLEDAATSGDTKAMILLAAMYRYGIGAKVNSGAANELYRKAAERGSAEAMYLLGKQCLSGKFEDRPDCIRLLQNAANLGNVRAMYELGFAYSIGRGEDPAEAARFYRQAADLGHAKAAYSLSIAYIAGKGVEKNLAEAVVYSRKAAALGHVPAMRQLGALYRGDWGGGTAAKDIGEAVKFYRKAVSLGDGNAMLDLAKMYRHGEYGLAQDSAEALRLYRSATGISRTLSMSQYIVATAFAEQASMYANGEGVAKDMAEAARLYIEAARRGNSLALYELSGMFERGEGVERNAGHAAKLAVLAIEKNERRALQEAPFPDRSEAFRLELQKLLAERVLYKGPIDGTANEALKQAVQALAARNKNSFPAYDPDFAQQLMAR